MILFVLKTFIFNRSLGFSKPQAKASELPASIQLIMETDKRLTTEIKIQKMKKKNNDFHWIRDIVIGHFLRLENKITLKPQGKIIPNLKIVLTPSNNTFFSPSRCSSICHTGTAIRIKFKNLKLFIPCTFRFLSP